MDGDDPQINPTHDVLMQIRELDHKITDRQDRMAKSLKELKKTSDDISDALLGDKFNPQGLVKIVEDHEVRIVRVERRLDRILWTTVSAALGGAVGGGTLGAYLVDLMGHGG